MIDNVVWAFYISWNEQISFKLWNFCFLLNGLITIIYLFIRIFYFFKYYYYSILVFLLISWFPFMFQAMNLILLTSSELSELRDLLKKSLVNPAGKDLFVSLYASWCHSPMAIISLCLLAQVSVWNFIMASALISFSVPMQQTFLHIGSGFIFYSIVLSLFI